MFSNKKNIFVWLLTPVWIFSPALWEVSALWLRFWQVWVKYDSSYFYKGPERATLSWCRWHQTPVPRGGYFWPSCDSQSGSHWQLTTAAKSKQAPHLHRPVTAPRPSQHPSGHTTDSTYQDKRLHIHNSPSASESEWASEIWPQMRRTKILILSFSWR